MTSVIAQLIVLILVGLMAYAGYRDGVFFSAYALVRNAFAFVCAMTFLDLGAWILTTLIIGEYPAWDYFRVVSFAGIFAAVLAVGRFLKVKYTIPHVPFPFLVDRIGGPILGVMNAVVITGMLLVGYSLLPFAKYVPMDYGHVRVKFDTGRTMLKFYAFVEKRLGGKVPFLLEDEPLLADPNGNRRFDPDVVGESFEDLNGNGKWDRGWLWRYENHATVDPTAISAIHVPPQDSSQLRLPGEP